MGLLLLLCTLSALIEGLESGMGLSTGGAVTSPICSFLCYVLQEEV